MIKYLNRMKSKKGFSLVELVVVIAIIGVLIMVLLVNMIGGNTDKVLSANANAEVFFSACQLTFTRAQLTERSLVDYADSDTKFIEYKNGANTTDGKYLFVEAKFAQNGIVGLHIANRFNDLMSRADTNGTDMTALEQYLSTNINEYLSESYDGYFYALVDNNFKVLFTHYCGIRLPVYGGNLTDFRDSMMVKDGKVTGNEYILGSCSDTYIIPSTGEYVFALPALSDPNSGLYLA